jgi:hypothetical protein
VFEARNISVEKAMFMSGFDIDMAAGMLAYDDRAERSVRQHRIDRQLLERPVPVRPIPVEAAQPAI